MHMRWGYLGRTRCGRRPTDRPPITEVESSRKIRNKNKNKNTPVHCEAGHAVRAVRAMLSLFELKGCLMGEGGMVFRMKGASRHHEGKVSSAALQSAAKPLKHKGLR